MSIRARLAISHSLLAVCMFIVAAALIYLFYERTLHDAVDDDLRERATTIGQIIAATHGVVNEPGTAAGAGRVRIFNPDGEPMNDFGRQLGGEPLSQDGMASALAGEPGFRTTGEGKERSRVYYYATPDVGPPVAVVEVSERLWPTERALGRTRIALMVASIFAIPAGLLAGWWMARQALVPVNRLIAAVSTLAASGKYGERVPEPEVNDEIGRLARTFNDILGRLTVVLDRQQALVADTSHELRNPLMVVRGNLDLLVHDLPPDQRQEAANEAREEVDRMARLVDDLLFLADADTEGSIDRRQVELDEVMAELFADATAFSSKHNIQLNANDPVRVTGDEERLRQLIWNLIENAIRYTPPGGTINLALRRRAGVAEILVSDTGIGIPEEHLPHIFNRFYRVDRGRSRAVGGTGLGLSIVKQVAETHGGNVRVRSIPGIGTTFTVYLPLAEPGDPI